MEFFRSLFVRIANLRGYFEDKSHEEGNGNQDEVDVIIFQELFIELDCYELFVKVLGFTICAKLVITHTVLQAS